MSDDNPTNPTETQSPSTIAATSTGRQAINKGSATGTPIRRAMTIDESSSFKRRSNFSPGPGPGPSFDGLRRRSSTLSDYSLGEARDLFNPKPQGARANAEESSNWASVPLALALLPALGGVLFQNGSAIVTDVMLLGLAAIFLHWSVTQPWNWYHSAQQVRMRQELQTSMDVEDDSDTDRASDSAVRTGSPIKKVTSVDDIQEEEPPSTSASASSRRAIRSSESTDAMAELYTHEMMALVSCFLFPILGAYLLHAIRAQLSRPSEGLVSNYNLAIFLLASELRPFSHMVKLVQSRTLHLQKIVHENPYKSSTAATTAQMDLLTERLEALENRPQSQSPATPGKQAAGSISSGLGAFPGDSTRDALVRDVRGAIQPELDALNRAVRRYEKKLNVLSLQSEARFSTMETRLNDAIALAAAAAKNSVPQRGFLQWAAESLLDLVMLPFRGLVSLLLWPFHLLVSFTQSKKRKPEKGSRSRKGSKPSSQGPSGSDRPPSRVAKR